MDFSPAGAKGKAMTSLPYDSVGLTLLRAIQIEARNGALYDSLASIFDGYEDSVAELFREMAGEEREHGTELESRFSARFGPLPSLTGEPKEVIEAADLDDPEALIFDSMTPDRALEIGLHAEETAREFYRKEALQTSDPGLQQIYRELAEFEEGHVRALMEKLGERMRAADPAAR